MKLLIQGMVLGGIIGFLAGLVVGSKAPAPEPVRRTTRETDLEVQVARLREDLEASRRPVSEPAPGPLPPTPPASPAPAPKPATPVIEAPAEWRRQADSMNRIADLLALKLPDGEARQSAWPYLMARARLLLKEPDAQRVLMSDLYSMSTPQLVTLYDVFWTSGVRSERGFAGYGNGFAAQMSEALLQVVRNGPNAADRRLCAGMLIPDTRSLSDRKLQEFRALLEADPDPSMRKKVQDLPVRPE